MKTGYKNYTIEITDDRNYTIGSVDNITSYNQVVFDEGIIPTSQHGISVKNHEDEINSIIICEGGGASTIHERSFIIDDGKIFLCCGDHVYCLELPSLTVVWKRKLDPATCVGIYEYKNEFLVHGELEISRIDKQGNKRWDFSARDIFVTQDGKESIEIKEDRIKLRDWEGYEYVIDENGRGVGD